MGAGASFDTGEPEGDRDTRTVLRGDLESAISHAFNTSAAAHPEWRNAPPATSEILRSIANSMLAMAELFRSYQSVAAYDLVAARSTNEALRARGMGDVESAIRQAIDTAAAAYPEWRQDPPAVSEILQSIANSMLVMAANQALEAPPRVLQVCSR